MCLGEGLRKYSETVYDTFKRDYSFLGVERSYGHAYSKFLERILVCHVVFHGADVQSSYLRSYCESTSILLASSKSGLIHPQLHPLHPLGCNYYLLTLYLSLVKNTIK